MRLDALLSETRGVSLTLGGSGAPDVEVTSVVHDSRAVEAGALFCCVPGATVDGHDLADEAARGGAVALLVERPLPTSLPQLQAPSVRDALGPVAAAFWGHPSDHLDVVGVTGTSGKTTTTHLLGSIFSAHGWRAAVLGTLTGPRTTPEAPELQAHLAAERDAGHGPWPWRCRRTRSPWAECGRPASPWPSSRTSRTTTSTSTATWTTTSRRRPCCSPRTTARARS